MFEGGGFGVGLTVNQLDVPPCPADGLPAGADVHPTRLGELMPVAARTDDEMAEEMRRANIADSRLWAYRVEMIAALAARRRDDRDRAPGRPGAAAPRWAPPIPALEGISEFFLDELAMIFNCSRAEATRLAVAALTLAHRLPEAWAALADGGLSWSRARAIAQEVDRHGTDVDPQVLAAVEAIVVPQAPELSVTRLQALVRTEIVRRDAEAADRRRRQAAQAANVRLRRLPDGMAELIAVLPHPMAVAIWSTVDGLARLAAADDDSAPIGHLRVGVLGDLAFRPWDGTRPAVTAEVAVVAPLNSLLADPARPDAPGCPIGVAHVEGEPVTAAHLRALLTAVDAICPGGLQPPTGGSLRFDVLGDDGALRATLTRRELEEAVRRGCPAHPEESCGCSVIGPPPPTERYTPTAAQRRFTTARDRQCRHPGCRNEAGWADLDHVIPHADGGPTDCDNLCCLCRRHHRLKTHAPGWSFRLDAAGCLHVTTPSGVTRVTRPPGSLLLEPYELGPPPRGWELDDPSPF
jgi:hypothetical protein